MPANEEQGSGGQSSTGVTIISPGGGLLLEAIDEKRDQSFTYRVDVQKLRQTSAYFERLLDPMKFGEGATVSRKLESLRRSYKDIAGAPTHELPRVQVTDVGRTSKVNSIKLLFGDFLNILHGQDIATGPVLPGGPAMPVANIANLAVVADRFDALPHIGEYIHRKRILESMDARSKAKSPKYGEERLRQKLLVGTLFDHAAWVMSSSQSLIINDSARWKQDVPEDSDLPLWWDLPHGLEDELITRRDYILDTLQSIALHFINLYSSGTQQCKLGYASSWICDSFQLGEMTRFLKKNNLIKIGPVLTGQDEADPYAGDIERIIEIYKSCPTYRMDEHHTHCGLRTRLVPLIGQLEVHLHAGSPTGVGICGDCWSTHRAKYAWSEAKRPVSWQGPVPRPPSQLAAKKAGTDGCLQQHIRVRDMFMAVDRDWTPREESREGIKFGTSTSFLKHD